MFKNGASTRCPSEVTCKVEHLATFVFLDFSGFCTLTRFHNIFTSFSSFKTVYFKHFLCLHFTKFQNWERYLQEQTKKNDPKNEPENYSFSGSFLSYTPLFTTVPFIPFWSLLILLLSVASIRRKLLKTTNTEERSVHTNSERCNIQLRP